MGQKTKRRRKKRKGRGRRRRRWISERVDRGEGSEGEKEEVDEGDFW